MIFVLNFKFIFIISIDNFEVKFKKEIVCILYNIFKILFIIVVLEFFSSEFCSRRVSLEFLYGMWVFFSFIRVEMTLFRVERDRLILVVFFSFCFVVFVLVCFFEFCNIWMVNELFKIFFLFIWCSSLLFVYIDINSFFFLFIMFLNIVLEFFIKIIFM